MDNGWMRYRILPQGWKKGKMQIFSANKLIYGILFLKYRVILKKNVAGVAYWIMMKWSYKYPGFIWGKRARNKRSISK